MAKNKKEIILKLEEPFSPKSKTLIGMRYRLEEKDVKHPNNLFQRIADWISWFIGTPLNIVIWVIAVTAWFLLFALDHNLINTTFMPAWFTSNSFNFPLNTVTTLMELYIGFFLGAASNRSEKNLKHILHSLQKKEQRDLLLNVTEEAENRDIQAHLHRIESKLNRVLKDHNDPNNPQ